MSKIFSESIIEIANSFALNLFKLGVEANGREIKRELTIIRSHSGQP